MRISSGLRVVGAAAMLEWTDDLVIGGLAAAPDGTQLRVANPQHHRVFRIRDPLLESRRADVLLGQGSASETECDRARSCAVPRNSLCDPGAVALDRLGNVYVSDASPEGDGNFRLLEFGRRILRIAGARKSLLDSGFFPRLRDGASVRRRRLSGSALRPVAACFRVERSDGRRDEPLSRGEPVSPDLRRAARERRSRRLTSTTSSTQPYAAAFDSRDNLYLADLNRARVLVYWNPLNIPGRAADVVAAAASGRVAAAGGPAPRYARLTLVRLT